MTPDELYHAIHKAYNTDDLEVIFKFLAIDLKVSYADYLVWLADHNDTQDIKEK